MRIAVPAARDAVAESLRLCTAVKLYEDDHGKITKRGSVPVTAEERAIDVIERCGADVLLCGALPPEEERELAASGVLLARSQDADVEAAVRSYLDAAIACDPSNECNYCGFRDECGKARQQ